MKIPNLAQLQTKIEFDLESLKTEPMVNLHLYILGRNPILSIGEVMSLSHTINTNQTIEFLHPEGMIVSNPKGKFPSIIAAGAILKRCQPIAILSKNQMNAKFPSQFQKYIENIFIDEKCSWTISAYNEKDDQDIQYYGELREIVKKGLKKAGIRKAMYVKPQEDRKIRPQRGFRKGFGDDGLEIVLFHLPNNQLLIAHTLEILNVDQFENQDKHRPHKRPLLLLGLALARTMINLVSSDRNRHYRFEDREQLETKRPIYDPFCGMGSILHEALIDGHPIWGSDIDNRCIPQTQENLNWLIQNDAKNFASLYNPDQVFSLDLTNQNQIENNFVKMTEFTSDQAHIVAEPDLLTPLKTYPSVEEARHLLSDYMGNYREYLKNIKQILPADSQCVLIFPQLHLINNQREGLPLKQLLKDYDFEVSNIVFQNGNFPAIFVHNWKDPIIERQIVVFKHRSS